MLMWIAEFTPEYVGGLANPPRNRSLAVAAYT